MRSSFLPRSARAARRVGGQRQQFLSTAVLDIASEVELKAGSTSAAGNVLLAKKKVEWKPRSMERSRVPVETSQLFCASNDPLQHTSDDVGKFFQLEAGTALFELFYHIGFCGGAVEDRARRLQSSAMMVRERGLEVRDELLRWQREGTLGKQQGLLLTGESGVGKSCVLNYVLSCCQQSGWLVVAMPQAADWTLGLGAKDCRHPNEAYRVTDPAYFTDLPPELAGADALYENPEATAHLLISTYLSQRPALEKVRLKGAERIAHYAARAKDQNAGPTLADMLAPYATDESGSFSDFPMPLRPVYDLFAELSLATEVPVLVAVDGHNRWDQMASSCHWHTKVPLHASELLVPKLLGDLSEYGGAMANGVVVGSVTHGGAQPPGVPPALRKHIPPPHDFTRPRSLPPALRALLRPVGTYAPKEMQAALEFYALTGHLANRGLEAQLRDGSLRTKVGLLTAGVPDDVFKICEQL